MVGSLWLGRVVRRTASGNGHAIRLDGVATYVYRDGGRVVGCLVGSCEVDAV